MKTLIVAINTKYIHSSLAAWRLKASSGPECGDVCVREFTTNDSMERILSSIYRSKPDIVAFSCHIWNIRHVLHLAASLKKILPEAVIVLGGPEVSYDAADMLAGNDYIDFIVAGEGEEAFPALLKCIAAAGIYSAHVPCNEKRDTPGGKAVNTGGARICKIPGIESVRGLAWRSEKGIISRKPAIIENLDAIPSPYTDEMLAAIKDRIVYFESSRGCPFSCSYCLSSAEEGVRYFSLERVFSELDRLVSSGVRQIKFVDRTFNALKKRAKEIIQHILELGDSGAVCNFHFEVGADLFDEEMLDMLASSPKGLIQIEAGVQSANEKTLLAVRRKTDLLKLSENLEKVAAWGNVHVHADLIAGLPFEDYGSFRHSFNYAYETRPHHLQVGFLKFLKGTLMRRRAQMEGYEFLDHPPYEILRGRHISFDELIILKGIAGIVDMYYNTGRFAFSLDYIIKIKFPSPFDFYEDFYNFLDAGGFMEANRSAKELYSFLHGYASGLLDNKEMRVFCELLKVDFLASDSSGALPPFLAGSRAPGFNEKCRDFLRNTAAISALIPGAAGMTPGQVQKKVHFEQLLADCVSGILDHAANSAAVPASAKSAVRSFETNGMPYAESESHVSAKPSNDLVTLLFAYFSRDGVTGRYPFFYIQL